MRRIGLAGALALGAAAAIGCGGAASPAFPNGGPTPTPTFTPVYGPGPDGGMLWALLDRDPAVAGTDEAIVETVRVATMTTGARLSLGVPFAASMAVRDDGSALYVARPDAGEVSFHDGATGALLGSAPLPGAHDVALSADGTWLFAAGDGTAMALTYQRTRTTMALGTGVTATAVAADPFDDATFALATTGTAGAVVLASAAYGAPFAISRTALAGRAGCAPAPADLAFGPGGGVWVWDEPCDALESLPDGMTESTAALAVFANAGDTALAANDQLVLTNAQALALGESAALSLDLGSMTTTSALGLATAPTTQATDYDGAVSWIATRPAAADQPAMLARWDLATNALTGAVYAFAKPGWYVRDLTYLDRPPVFTFVGTSYTGFDPREFFAPPGKPVTVLVSASDPDGEPTTITMTSGPGVFDAALGVWKGTAPACSATNGGVTLTYPVDFAAQAGRWTTPDRIVIAPQCPFTCSTGPLFDCGCGCTIASRPGRGGALPTLLGAAALAAVISRRRRAR